MNNEELQYRGPFNTVAPSTVDRDIEEYSTLKQVQGLFQEAVDALHRDFNSFDVKGERPDDEKIRLLAYDIDMRQRVFKIVDPLLEMVNNAVTNVDAARKEK